MAADQKGADLCNSGLHRFEEAANDRLVGAGRNEGDGEEPPGAAGVVPHLHAAGIKLLLKPLDILVAEPELPGKLVDAGKRETSLRLDLVQERVDRATAMEACSEVPGRAAPGSIRNGVQASRRSPTLAATAGAGNGR